MEFFSSGGPRQRGIAEWRRAACRCSLTSCCFGEEKFNPEARERLNSQGQHKAQWRIYELTSVSSVLSSSCPLTELLVEDRDQNEDDGAMDECARCRPAFSRSGSDHERMVARRESISNLFASARGVVRKDRRTFVTRRRSTLVSVELRLSRRKASVRCSLLFTAVGKMRCNS